MWSADFDTAYISATVPSVDYRTLIESRVDLYRRRAAAMTGSARNSVLVPFDFGTWRRGYYPHSGLVTAHGL